MLLQVEFVYYNGHVYYMIMMVFQFSMCAIGWRLRYSAHLCTCAIGWRLRYSAQAACAYRVALALFCTAAQHEHIGWRLRYSAQLHRHGLIGWHLCYSALP